MLTGGSQDITKLAALCPAAAGLFFTRGERAAETDGFAEDPAKCVLFCVISGLASFATTWREAAASREVTAAATVGAGSWALFLPGERFMWRGPGADVRAFVLD